MDIEQEKVDELQAVLKVRIEPEDYKEKYDAALDQYRKQINMPGFRPGKVPKGLVKKKYGRSILVEEVNKVLEQSVQEYIRNQELNILGSPLPREDDGLEQAFEQEEPSTLEFKYDLGFAPDIELELPKKKFPYYKVKVDDEMLNEQVNNMAKRYGKLVSVEESEKEDMLMGSFTQLDGEGNEMEDGIHRESSSIVLSAVDDEEAKKQLTGLKQGEAVDIDPARISKGPADQAAMLGVEKDDIEGMDSLFRFKVQDIKRMEPAELNQELFDKIYGEGVVDSEEAFREKVREELEKNFVPEADQLFHKQVQDTLLEKLDVDLPDDFLKKYIKVTNKGEVTDEQIEKEYDQYARSLKWQLIEDKVVRQNELKVEQEEALQHTKQLLAQQYQQYGIPAPPEEELKNSAQKVLSGEESKRIYESLYSQKVLEYFKNELKTEEKEISRDEFSKLAAEAYEQGEEEEGQ